MKGWWICCVFAIVLLVIFLCNRKEYFGQDATSRVQSGWIAGNGMYGYDPIADFQKQIDEMHTSESKEEYCSTCF